MREVVHGRVNPRVWALALLTVALCVFAFAAPAFAASSPEPVSASPTASEAAVPASPAAAAADSASPVAEPVPFTLTCVLSGGSVVFGDTVTVNGVLAPATEAQEVVVTFGGVEVGRVLTDATGAYTLTFTPRRSGDVVAALGADPTVVGPTRTVAVKPKATVSHGTLDPVPPVDVHRQGGAVRLRRRRRAQGGAPQGHRGDVQGARPQRPRRLPGAAPRRRRLHAHVHPAGRRRARRPLAPTKVAVRAKTLSAGATGPYVKGMLTGLQRLAIRIPGMGSTFTTQVKDSVMAFQKAYRLSRTYVFNTSAGASWTAPRPSSRGTPARPRTSRSTRAVRSS